jgi:hypothetical protein
MLPVIGGYLDKEAVKLGLGGALSSEFRARVLCNASIIGIRP